MTPGDAAYDRDFARYCRRLMLAYPGHYRRRHGTEIVTTLLEMAAPGQRRLSLGETAHLLASGLRQRFRLPAGRPSTAVAAVLVALTAGAFGAAAGSWTGAQTFADLPDDSAMVTLAQRASGVTGETDAHRSGSPWRHESAMALAEGPHDWNVEQARQRFAADGWSVSGVTASSGGGSARDPDTGALIRYRTRASTFDAWVDGLTITVRGDVGDLPPQFEPHPSGVSIYGYADSTAVFLPLIVVGTVSGLIAGWLLAATVAYRLRRAPVRRRRTAAGVSTLALLTLALPAVALYGNVMRVFRPHLDEGAVGTVHSAFTPGDYYPFGPAGQILALTVAGAVIAAAAVLLAGTAKQAQSQEAPVPG
jgi:hypothetical protein